MGKKATAESPFVSAVLFVPLPLTPSSPETNRQPVKHRRRTLRQHLLHKVARVRDGMMSTLRQADPYSLGTFEFLKKESLETSPQLFDD